MRSCWPDIAQVITSTFLRIASDNLFIKHSKQRSYVCAKWDFGDKNQENLQIYLHMSKKSSTFARIVCVQGNRKLIKLAK